MSNEHTIPIGQVTRESTLTAPEDRDITRRFQLDHAPSLSNQETQNAMESLNITSYVQRFSQVERRYADPPIMNQTIGLFSFIPAKGATPNEKGVYGFAKLRGNYANEDEANAHAEDLIRNVDSYHQIYHTFVGRPFPLTVSSDYSAKISSVDLKKEMTQSIGEDIKKKREQEQKTIEEIQEREKELLADVAKREEDVADRYTSLKTKKAQLTWTYVETEKKLQQMLTNLARTRKELEDLDQQDPQLKNIYYEKYMDARRKAGFTDVKANNDQSFMKYLVEDLTIPAVDEEYRKIYGNTASGDHCGSSGDHCGSSGDHCGSSGDGK
jgi:hypothetical protein